MDLGACVKHRLEGGGCCVRENELLVIRLHRRAEPLALHAAAHRAVDLGVAVAQLGDGLFRLGERVVREADIADEVRLLSGALDAVGHRQVVVADTARAQRRRLRRPPLGLRPPSLDSSRLLLFAPCARERGGLVGHRHESALHLFDRQLRVLLLEPA